MAVHSSLNIRFPVTSVYKVGIGIATVGVATLATLTLSNTVVLLEVSNITHLATLLIIINIVIN